MKLNRNLFISLWLILIVSSCKIIKINDHDNCQLINKLLTNERFCAVRSFGICNSDTLKFIDSNLYFQQCYNRKINQKTVLIRVNKDYVPSGFMSLEKRINYSNVISIDNLLKSNDTIILKISRKISNHTGEIKFVRKMNTYDLVDIRIGQY